MVFFVNVASDVYARKHNVRMEYPTCPTVSELINTVESQLDVTARASRPAGYPDIPFRVQTFQIYDDVLMRWVDLYSSAQLSSGCQLYAFQPDTVWTVDLQGTIPVARDSVSWASSVGSPRRGVLAASAGVAPTMSEKLRSAFYELDQGNKGYVLYTDLRSAFIRMDIDFSYATVGELFNAADRNGDGHISYEEWVRFALDHPNVVDALFFRARDIQSSRSALAVSVADDLAYASARRARETELDRLYRESAAAQERSIAQRSYDDAKRESELARTRASAAAAQERSALDKLYYTPSSPRSMYR
jgi:hypothetical protein